MDEERKRRLQLMQMQARLKQERAPKTNMVEQSMSGVNEGIANMAGFPVDAITGGINAATRGINSVAGTDIQPITDPVGGSESLKSLMAPTISDVPPQTAAQRYGRRIGQEVGASVVPGGIAMRSAQSPARVAMGTGASATAAGAAGQTSREIDPENDTMDMIASILGGAAVPAGMYANTPKPMAPDPEDLRARQRAAYGVVDASDTRLNEDSTAALQEAIRARASRDEMDPIISPKAYRTGEKISELQTPTIGEVEKMRRLAGRVAGNTDPTEAALGMGMKDEITDYLNSITQENVTGGDPAAAVGALREGREMTGRIKRYEQVLDAVQKAERRAATGGIGGNQVNAIRQNVRAILDNPKKRAGYKADEIAKMEDLVRGTASTNTLRAAGRMSPTTGALQQFAGGAMMTGAASTANPLLAIPPTAGYFAKARAENMTNKQLQQLQELILNGAPLDKKQMTDAQKRVLAAMMAGQVSGEPQ